MRVAQVRQRTRGVPPRRCDQSLAAGEPTAPPRVERPSDLGRDLPLKLVDATAQLGSRRRVGLQLRRRRLDELRGGQLAGDLSQARRRLGHHQHHRLPRAESLDGQPGDALLPSEVVRLPLGPRQRKDHDAVTFAGRVRFVTRHQPRSVDEPHVEEPQGARLEQVPARHERRPRRLTLQRQRHREVVRQLALGTDNQIVEIQIAAFPNLERIAELAEHEDRLLLQAFERPFRRPALAHTRRDDLGRRAKADLIAEHPQQTDRLQHPLVDGVRPPGQPPDRGVDLRPRPAVPAEDAVSEHARRVVVEPVDRVQPAWPIRTQEIAEAERFAGGQEREQRPFVLGETAAEQRTEQGCRDRMERPTPVQVSGQSRFVPAGALGYPGCGGRDDSRPVRGVARLTAPPNRGRRESDDLIAAFAKRKLSEAALDLRPLVAIRRSQLVGVPIERLMQDGQDHERDAVAARRGLRERLQQVDVATSRLLRRVLQRLAGLVDDEQQARTPVLSPIVRTASSKHPTTSDVAQRESAGADPFSSRLMVVSTRGFAPRWVAQMSSTVERNDLRGACPGGPRSAVSSAGNSDCRGVANSIEPSRSLLAASLRGNRSPTGDPPGRRRTRSCPIRRGQPDSTPGRRPRHRVRR